MGNGVSNRQIFFIIFLVVSGFTVIELPMTMAKSVGTGAWLVLLVATIIFSIFVAIIAYLNNKFTGQTLFEYSSFLVGKPIAYIFAGIYTVYFFATLALLLNLISNLIQVDLLVKTPIWATLLLIIIIASYTASKGLTNVGRFLEAIGVLVILFFVFVIPIMLITGDWLNIFPLFDTKEIKTYMLALPMAIMPFLGIEVLTIIPFSKANEKKVIFTSIASIGCVGLLYILLVEGTYMILGVQETKIDTDALLMAFNRTDITAFQFFERLDLVSAAYWLIAMFATIVILIFVVTSYANKIIKKAKPNLLMIIIGILAFIAAQIPDTNGSAKEMFGFLTMYLGFIPAFLIPIILLIVAKIKKA